MRKFSWYTIIHPDWNKGEPPLFRLVGPAILPDERTCDIYFKPNRKGGHTHNHDRNALERKLNRSKASRKRCHNHLNKGYNYKLYFQGMHPNYSDSFACQLDPNCSWTEYKEKKVCKNYEEKEMK